MAEEQALEGQVTQAEVAQAQATAPQAPEQAPPQETQQLSLEAVEKIVEERLSTLKKELQSLRKAAKREEEPAPNPQEALLAELESLWELEVADLPKSERDLLTRILPSTLSPLDRLKIVRGLRAAGKLGTAPANVGTRAPAPATPPKPEAESPEQIARRILGFRKIHTGQGRVPPGWEGR